MKKKDVETIKDMLAPIYRALDNLMPPGVTSHDSMLGRNYDFSQVHLPSPTDNTDMESDVPGEPASLNKRAEILHTAEKLINGDRAQVYGAPEVSFGRIADIWNAQGYRHHVQVLGQPIGVTMANELDAVDAALILIGMKLSRTSGSRQHEDNWIDLAGYAGLGAELALPETDTKEQQYLVIVKWDEQFQCYICADDGAHIDQLSVGAHLYTDHPSNGRVIIEGGPTPHSHEKQGL